MKSWLIIASVLLAFVSASVAQVRKTIPELPVAASSVNAADLMALWQGDQTKRLSMSTLARELPGLGGNTALAWLLADTELDTIAPSQNGIGWADDKLTIQAASGGALQIYQTGSPLENTIYWPGRLTVDTVEAAAFAGSISGALIDSGVIPMGVMNASLPAPFSGFVNDSAHAGAIGGLTYANTGPSSASEPATPGTYFAAIEVTDGGTENVNALEGRIKTFAQMGVPNLVSAPATASSVGTAGQVAYDASYFYVCTAANTWKRTALSTW